MVTFHQCHSSLARMMKLIHHTTSPQDRFRLRDRYGAPTHLGHIIKSQLEADLWEEGDCSVCRACRRTLLRLEKLKTDYEALKGDLKAKLLHRRSRRARLRFRSPSAIGALTSPAAKRVAPSSCFPQSNRSHPKMKTELADGNKEGLLATSTQVT